jgi:alpha-glucosidase
MLILTDWNPQEIRKLVQDYESKLKEGNWPNWVMGNHDQHRIASRVGVAQARIANILLLTIRGTPTTYYGEELGMENVPIPNHLVVDPPAVNQLEIAHIVGRDPERTPMIWDYSPNAGFTGESITPWLPITENYKEICVENQLKDPTSMLELYKSLTNLRKREPALCVGDIEILTNGFDTNEILGYLRTFDGSDSFLILLNFGIHSQQLDLSNLGLTGQIEVSTDMKRGGEVDLKNLQVYSNEGLVLRL